MYALLAFFAVDNVIVWMASPFIFYPMVLVGSFIIMLISVGLGGLIKPIFRMIVNRVMGLTRMNFSI